MFLHGDDEGFLSWVESLGEALVPGWPHRVEGKGTPCQPQAFDPLQRRFGLKSGVRGLAASLASGLDVVPQTLVTALDWGPEFWTVATDRGPGFRGRNLVLALALEQTRGLLASLGPGPGAEVARKADGLLGQFASLPCLTVLAQYPPGTPTPPWDLWLPEGSQAVLLVSNEGSKRGLDPDQGVFLTIQARPGWSAARMETDREAWGIELLAEAASVVGSWAGNAGAFVTHRWKYGRLAPADHLVRPLVYDRPGASARLGVTGDLFDPDGGLQGAWKAGRRLAYFFQ